MTLIFWIIVIQSILRKFNPKSFDPDFWDMPSLYHKLLNQI